MMKLLLSLLLLSAPVLAGQKSQFLENPKLNTEFEQNYYEHKYGNFVTLRASTGTISQLNVTSITVNGANLNTSTFGILTATQTWSGGNTYTGTFTASTGTIQSFMVVGAASGDAPVGRVGEIIQSTVETNQNFPLNNVIGDCTSITLTPGDWDVTALLYINNTGVTSTAFLCGVTTTSGNSGAGLVSGVNEDRSGSVGAEQGLRVPSYRVTPGSTQTIYLKIRATYSAGTPKYQCRLTARRSF